MLLNGNGAFMVLLLITGVSTGFVLPPANVTLSCSNLNVTVSWDYSKQQPQTSFRVQIRGSDGENVSETTEHQYDLSHFIWASEDRYMGFHVVTLTAIEGGNQSEPVTKTFTFNYLKPANIKCELDFPPVDVDVNEKDSRATVSFMNPLFFYRELKQADKPDTASFKFTVSSDTGDFDGSCTAQQDNCRLDIKLSDDAEKCVSLKGLLFDGNGFSQVSFRKTARVCASKYTDVYILTLTIGLLVLVIIISVIIILICKAKAWTMKIPSPPKPLTTDPHLTDHRGLKYVPVSPTDISPISVSVNKPCKNPSVSTEEDNDLQDVVDDHGSQPPDRSYAENGYTEGYLRDDDSADDSVKTEIVSIDLEEEVEEVSPYDRPHALQVDMGDGDMVTGYSER